MPFFQNPFNTTYTGAWVLGDRNLLLNFTIPGNFNNDWDMVCWNDQPYNVSSSKTLTINYSFDTKNYQSLAIDVSTTASSTSAAKAYEIVSALNANTTFTTYYIASVTRGTGVRIQVNDIYRQRGMRTYIANTSAESILKFNKNAGIAEIPSYFARHTIANANNYTDSAALLVQLDGTVSTDQNIIRAFTGNGSWTTANLLADWQMMNGRSGIFNFQNITVDGSGRITSIIFYPCGASAGDLAKKTTYTYTGANTNPSKICEQPYTLASGDLITP